MKKMAGIVIMVVGVLIFGFGLYFYVQAIKDTGIVTDKATEAALPSGDFNVDSASSETGMKADPVQNAGTDNQSTQWDNNSDAEETNKKQGDDFEKYIVQKFSKNYFTLKEWAGDKYVKGVYAESTTQPDLLYEFRLKNEAQQFAVECKWRSNFYKNGIEFASAAQLARYKEYERSKNIPVFIAIGVGNSGGNPDRLFFVPLAAIESNFLPVNLLKKYEKADKSKNVFFDTELRTLR